MTKCRVCKSLQVIYEHCKSAKYTHKLLCALEKGSFKPKLNTCLRSLPCPRIYNIVELHCLKRPRGTTWILEVTSMSLVLALSLGTKGTIKPSSVVDKWKRRWKEVELWRAGLWVTKSGQCALWPVWSAKRRPNYSNSTQNPRVVAAEYSLYANRWIVSFLMVCGLLVTFCVKSWLTIHLTVTFLTWLCRLNIWQSKVLTGVVSYDWWNYLHWFSFTFCGLWWFRNQFDLISTDLC